MEFIKVPLLLLPVDNVDKCYIDLIINYLQFFFS